jgi:hypothetical protein
MRKQETEKKLASSSRFNGYENGIGRFRFDYSLRPPGSSHQPASFGEAAGAHANCVPPKRTGIVGNDDAVGHISLLVYT